jgi:hypothetical protein
MLGLFFIIGLILMAVVVFAAAISAVILLWKFLLPILIIGLPIGLVVWFLHRK